MCFLLLFLPESQWVPRNVSSILKSFRANTLFHTFTLHHLQHAVLAINAIQILEVIKLWFFPFPNEIPDSKRALANMLLWYIMYMTPLLCEFRESLRPYNWIIDLYIFKLDFWVFTVVPWSPVVDRQPHCVSSRFSTRKHPQIPWRCWLFHINGR